MSARDPLRTLARIARLRQDAAGRRWREAADERGAAARAEQESATAQARAERVAHGARAQAMSDPTNPNAWVWTTAAGDRRMDAAADHVRMTEALASAERSAAKAAHAHAQADIRRRGTDDQVARAAALAERRRDERAAEEGG